MQEQSTKTCTGCGQVKALDSFQRDRHKPLGRASRCKACRAAYGALWRASNPDYFNRYRSERLEQFAAYSRRWQSANPEYYRAYRSLHQEQYRDYRQTPKERARQAQWIKDNPEKVRAMFRVINNRRRAAEGMFTSEEWDALCTQYGGRCLRCGKTDRLLTVDHVIPICQGGTNWISNLQPLCGPCNSSKNGRTIDYRPFP